MSLKLVSLIFGGITLAGGATAIAVMKNNNSSDLKETFIDKPSKETKPEITNDVFPKPASDDNQDHTTSPSETKNRT